MITQTDAFSQPRIDDILDRINGLLYASVLDFIKGYWQGEINVDARQKTASSTSDGNYQYIKLPFGLKNAPEQF